MDALNTSVKQKLKDASSKPFRQKATFQQLSLLMQRILNQTILKYSNFDIPKYYCRLLCLRSPKHVKHSSKKDFYLNKGQKKLA